MDLSGFLQGRSRETTIRRDALGRWFHDEEPLEHPNLVRAFDRWVDRSEDGRYCLRNEINWAYITLEGPAFFVRSLRLEPNGTLWLQLSDDRQEPLVASTLRQGPDGALYCDVRGGTMPARFDRSAMQQLESVLREDPEGVYLLLGSQVVRPPLVSDPLRGLPPSSPRT